MVRPALLDDADARTRARRAARTAIAKALSPAGLGGARRGGLAERLVTRCSQQAEEYAERVRAGARAAGVLAELGLPLHELPLLGEGMDLAGLYQLATLLRKQGMS